MRFWGPNRSVRRSGLLLLALSLVPGILGWSLANPSRPNPLNIPAYPGAGVVDLPAHPQRYLARRVVFDTAASPAAVQAYYAAWLTAPGWDVGRASFVPRGGRVRPRAYHRPLPYPV